MFVINKKKLKDKEIHCFGQPEKQLLRLVGSDKVWMVLATLEVGTAAEEEGFERSYQDQGLVKVWEQKKVSKTVSSGISSLRAQQARFSKGINLKGRRSSPLLGNLSATVLLLGSCRPWGGKASRCWECNCNLLQQQVHLLLLGHYDHLDRFSFVQWTVRGVSSFVWLEDYGVSTHRDGLDR